jgi:metallo-beta-lactamase family protein
VLTHGHLDHVGRLPLLVRAGFGGPVFRHPATLDIAAIVLRDALKVARHEGAATAITRPARRCAPGRALDDRGKVLVPAFSIGRTQELLYHLRALVAEGELAEIPVVVDGPMGLDVTGLYERYRDAYDGDALALLRTGKPPLSFDTLYGARTGRASELARSIDGPAIVIAGSGMCSGGRILGHLEDLLPDPRTDVLLVGYQARGTLGRELLEANGRADRVSIRGRSVSVRARVTSINGLSAHAGQSELLDWVAAVPGVREVFAVHGEPGACDALVGAVRERLRVDALVPREGERHGVRRFTTEITGSAQRSHGEC